MATNKIIEEGSDFTPRFDSGGLITAIAQDANTGQILMVAHMNKEALDMTIKTGYAVYFSRSRRKLWKKGEESGHFQKVEQILVDCDQDCLVLKVKVDAGQCHVFGFWQLARFEGDAHRRPDNGRPLSGAEDPESGPCDRGDVWHRGTVAVAAPRPGGAPVLLALLLLVRRRGRVR